MDQREGPIDSELCLALYYFPALFSHSVSQRLFSVRPDATKARDALLDGDLLAPHPQP